MESNSQSLVITTTSELKTIISELLEAAFSKNNFNYRGDLKEEDKLLTIKDAAKFLKLEISTIYGLTSRRALPFMKKGKRIYFSSSELLDYVKAGKIKTIDELSELAEKHLQVKSRS